MNQKGVRSLQAIAALSVIEALPDEDVVDWIADVLRRNPSVHQKVITDIAGKDIVFASMQQYFYGTNILIENKTICEQLHYYCLRWLREHYTKHIGLEILTIPILPGEPVRFGYAGVTYYIAIQPQNTYMGRYPNDLLMVISHPDELCELLSTDNPVQWSTETYAQCVHPYLQFIASYVTRFIEDVVTKA